MQPERDKGQHQKRGSERSQPAVDQHQRRQLAERHAERGRQPLGRRRERLYGLDFSERHSDTPTTRESTWGTGGRNSRKSAVAVNAVSGVERSMQRRGLTSGEA